MARGKRKKKRTGSQRKFATAAKAANSYCHRNSNSTETFKSCMRTQMKKNLRAQGFKIGGKKTKKRGATPKCKGLIKSGPRKGRLKKGYTWKGAKGRCPRAA